MSKNVHTGTGTHRMGTVQTCFWCNRESYHGKYWWHMGSVKYNFGSSRMLVEISALFLAFWNSLPGAAGHDLRAVKDSQLELISYCTEHQTLVQSEADPDLTFSPLISPSSSQTPVNQMQWMSLQIMQNIPPWLSWVVHLSWAAGWSKRPSLRLVRIYWRGYW